MALSNKFPIESSRCRVSVLFHEIPLVEGFPGHHGKGRYSEWSEIIPCTCSRNAATRNVAARTFLGAASAPAFPGKSIERGRPEPGGPRESFFFSEGKERGQSIAAMCRCIPQCLHSERKRKHVHCEILLAKD